MGTQTEIDRLKGVMAGVTSVVGSAIAFIAGAAQQFRDAADDPDEIRAISDELDARRAELAQSLASGTPASDEVPAAEGGTGDDSANVDPESPEIVEAIAAATEPAPADEA